MAGVATTSAAAGDEATLAAGEAKMDAVAFMAVLAFSGNRLFG
jgi:hypothetical protein